MAARVTILFCLLAAICEGFDLQAAGVAAAGLSAEFRPGPDALGSFFSASTLGLFVGALIGGQLSDRIGRKSVLVLSIALFGVFSALTAFAWDFSSLIGARLLTGLGLGGALPNLIALTAEAAAPGRRSASVALVYIGNPLGGALASLVSLLVSGAHWRWIFLIGGLAPLLLVPAMARLLPESAAFRAERAAARAGAGAIASAVVSARPDSSRGLRAILGEGRAPWTLLLWISFGLELLILYLLLNWLPLLLHEAGLTRAQAATAQIGFNLGGALAGLTLGRLLEGSARSLTVLATFCAMPLVIWALARAPIGPAWIIAIVFVLGCAVLAAQAFLYAQAPRGYPTLIRGIGVGAAIAVGRVGSIIGPKLGGLLKAAGHSSSQLLLDLLPIVIVGSLCALGLAFYRPRAGVVE